MLVEFVLCDVTLSQQSAHVDILSVLELGKDEFGSMFSAQNLHHVVLALSLQNFRVLSEVESHENKEGRYLVMIYWLPNCLNRDNSHRSGKWLHHPALLLFLFLLSSSTLKWKRKAIWLRLLATRPVGAKRPLVHVDPATEKADGPHRKKLKTYLGIAAPEFDVPEASDLRTQKKILQTVRERWRQFKSDLTSKWALAANKESVDDIVCEKYNISKEKWAQFCQTHKDPLWEKQNTTPHMLSCGGYQYLENKLMDEKRKKKLEEVAKSGITDTMIDPSSPIKRHVKWKMVRTKKTGQMTSEAAKEIANKIDSLEDQASQGSIVAHGRQDILTAAIRRPEHPGRMGAVGAGVTIKQYFGPSPRTSRTSSSMAPKDLEQLTQQIRDQLEESIIEKMQPQGLALPPEPEVGPLDARVSIKESFIDPSGNDLNTGDSDKYGLYIKENPPRPVALGRVYKGSTTAHNIPLLHDQVKVGVEEVRDADALILVPTEYVKLVGETLNTFLAWPTHLVKRLSEQGDVGPAKPVDRSDHDVDDPLYLMTLTIPQLFLKPLQVMWDATVFGMFNEDFPLYIKHEDLFEIAYNGLDDTPQSKSKAGARWIVVKCNRQKGSTECGYYVMYWMSTIILGSFKNNWETYFNDARPLESKRLKVLHIQLAKYYLKVKNET
ncbi:hypothetical protein HKD37_15G042839 [Glycine soja]